jgi:hypothetical protein
MAIDMPTARLANMQGNPQLGGDACAFLPTLRIYQRCGAG